MSFKNIIVWLNFVAEEPIEELKLLLNDDYNLYECLEDETRYKVDSRVLFFCWKKFNKTEMEEAFWSNTVCFIDNDSFPDEIFNYLLENKLALVTLCHLPLKDDFLWRLIEVEDEPIITLGKRYYCDDKYSLSDLQFFLLCFETNVWLWCTLIDLETTDIKKERLFRKMLFKKTEFRDYQLRLLEKTIEKRLIKSSSAKVITKHYRSNNYRYLRGIAQNPKTPIEILEEMLKLEKVKYAKLIRNYALQNFERRAFK